MKKYLPALIAAAFSVGASARGDDWVSYEDEACSCLGYKNRKGEIVIPAKYVFADAVFRATAFVMEEDGSGPKLIDRKGNTLLVPFIFDNGPDYVVEGVFRFVENGKMGFATLDGKKTIPAQFDMLAPFEGGIAQYAIGGRREYDASGEHWRWVGENETGYINHAGQRFSKAAELKNGRRKVWTLKGRPVVLNRQGRIVGK